MTDARLDAAYLAALTSGTPDARIDAAYLAALTSATPDARLDVAYLAVLTPSALTQPTGPVPTVSGWDGSTHPGVLDGVEYGTTGNLDGSPLASRGTDGRLYPTDNGMTYLADCYEYALASTGLTPAASTALIAYGDAWTASDTQNTAGMRAVVQLRDRLSLTLTNHAVDGYLAGDAAAAAIGTSGTFSAGTSGLVLVAGVGLEDRRSRVPASQADLDQQLLATKNHLRALFVALSAAARIEQTAFTLTSWSSSATSDSTSSGGSHAVTTTEGATATYSVTTPGWHYLLTKGTDGVSIVGGKLTISHAGTGVAVQDLNAQHVDTGHLLTGGIGPLAIPLGFLTTGTLSITYSKNGRSGTVYGFLDALVRISSTPPTILAVKPITPAASSIPEEAMYDALSVEFASTILETPQANWTGSA